MNKRQLLAYQLWILRNGYYGKFAQNPRHPTTTHYYGYLPEEWQRICDELVEERRAASKESTYRTHYEGTFNDDDHTK
jgi:hypothetical protein